MKRIERENFCGLNESYPEIKEACCSEMEVLLKTLPAHDNDTIGEGEISGSVDWDQENKVLEIDNGWNDSVFVQFRFCPFCGKEQK